MTLQESISSNLKDRTLSDCMQLGISPNGNAPGHLPEPSEKEIKEWASGSVQLAIDLSKKPSN